MSIEVTGETKVRTDCLNFDVTLCIAYKLKDTFELGEEGISYIHFCGILDHATVHDCTKLPSLITNVLRES